MARALAPAALLCLAAALAGCDSPHPLSDFAGVPPTRIEVEGAVYAVRVAGGRAQAVRRNVDFAAATDPQAFVARSGLAMERASGCRVVAGTLEGDAAMSEARLAC